MVEGQPGAGAQPAQQIFAFAPGDQLALAAACELASFHQKGWPCVKLSRLADNLRLSDRKSHEAMDRLIQLNLVRSVRGPSGGYRLTIAWTQIRVSHVLQESLSLHPQWVARSPALERLARSFGQALSSMSGNVLLKDMLGDRDDIERFQSVAQGASLSDYPSLADSMTKPLVTSVFDLAGRVQAEST